MNRSDAERWERAKRVAMDRGEWVDPSAGKVRFKEWAASWLESNPAKRPSAYSRDESIIRCHLNPRFGSTPIARITAGDVRAAVDSWTETMAPRSVTRVYGTLRAILAAAVADDLMGRSPCRGVKLPSAQAVRCHVVDAEELAALAEALGRDKAPMAYLGAVLGLRWGEVAGLRVGALDFLRCTLEVVEQVTRGKGGTVIMGAPKSDAGRRRLAMPAWLTEMLSASLAARGLSAADSTAFVFPNEVGGPLDYSHWRDRVWLPAVRAAGLDGLRFHDLRRAAATALVAAGVDAKTTQTRMGHSDVRLTLAVYAEATDDRDRAAADAVGAAFTPSMCHIRAIAPA